MTTARLTVPHCGSGNGSSVWASSFGHHITADNGEQREGKRGHGLAWWTGHSAAEVIHRPAKVGLKEEEEV